MRLINRSQLEGELFIYQRSDVADKRRWYCSYKLKGHKRVYVNLGVCTQAEAKKEARQELMKAEDILKDYGEDAVFGKHTVKHAHSWFVKHGRQYVRSDGRYETIVAHWRRHLLDFYGRSTVIDKKLKDRTSKYLDYRRRVIDKKTKKRLKATVGTLRLELVSAKQLLTVARVEGGIGKEIENLTSGIDKKKLALKKTKTSEFQFEEIAKIQEYFDADRAELDARLKDSTRFAFNKRATTVHILQLERLRFFVALAFASGFRVNEGRQVRVGDISKDFKTLRIRKSKTTKGTNRVAYLDAGLWDIREAYKHYVKACKAMGYELDTAQGKELFPSVNSAESGMRNVGLSFLRFLRKHKMYYDKIHGKRARSLLAVRSTWITHQINKGVGSYLVAQSAGTSLAMIEATYYKQNEKALVSAFEDFGNAGTTKRHLKVVK
jgi:integrase